MAFSPCRPSERWASGWRRWQARGWFSERELPHWAAVIGLGLALGGAAGNLADRIVRGAVVDFIALSHWPTFKLADAAMVAGGGLIAWSLI